MRLDVVVTSLVSSKFKIHAPLVLTSMINSQLGIPGAEMGIWDHGSGGDEIIFALLTVK